MSEGVAIVRPSRDGLGALADEIAAIAKEPRIHAVVIVPDALSGLVAGANVSALREARTAREAEAIARSGRRVIDAIAGLDKPKVAACLGPALGTAFEVALACDARVLASDPLFFVGLPEVCLGVLPALGGLDRLAARVGLRAAMELGISGRPIGPTEARRIGVVDEVVPSGATIEAAVALASSLASASKKARPARLSGRLRRLFVEKNPLGRALLFRRARKTILAETFGHDLAKERILDVLAAFLSRGARASSELALSSFGLLAVSAHAARLMEVHEGELARRAEAEPPSLGFVGERLTRAYAREAAFLCAEGIAPSRIDDALAAWGFTAAPVARPAAGVSTLSGDAPGLLVEEIQMRCVLAVVFEAARALDEGALPRARDVDLAAIEALGFPRFRGGPLRWVDAIGADEVLARAKRYEARVGERFEPPASLVAKHAARAGFYA